MPLASGEDLAPLDDSSDLAARECHRYGLAEWTWESDRAYADPFNEVTLDALIVGPQGDVLHVPGFWAGGSQWRVRFSPRQAGAYTLRTVCSDADNRGLHGRRGMLSVTEYTGDNPLYRHGPLHVTPDGRHLAHEDGRPFLWLGDTWWLGLTDRLDWPHGFQTLAADRQAKGFSVIQVLAGLFCDMPAHDPRGANEGGLAWEQGYTRVNPAFFDWADLRIAWLVGQGLVPCLFGAWSFYLLWMGVERMKQHWRYLVARYGAYPVIWCLAGGGTMPFYVSEDREGDRQALRRGWSELAHYLAAADPYGHPIALHPSPRGAARHELDADAPYDLPMHHVGDLARVLEDPTPRPDAAALDVRGEICYPGMAPVERHELQRILFWITMLSGAAGFTYGVNGMWQFNAPERPFGPSPNGHVWPSVLWQDASQLSSASQVGWGRRLLERHRWWAFERHPEWVEPHVGPDAPWRPYAAGIPGEVRMIYLPHRLSEQVQVTALEPGASYRVLRYNPRDGCVEPLGMTTGAEWAIPKTPDDGDWLFVLERAD